MTWRLLVPHLRPHQSLQATTRVFRIGRSLSRLSRSFHTIWLRLLAPVHGNICIYLWYIYFYIFWKTKISALNSRMIEQQWMINLRQASSRAITFCSRININFSFLSCFLKVSLFLSNTNFKIWSNLYQTTWNLSNYYTSIREGFVQINPPLPLPLIWTTCTTFFERLLKLRQKTCFVGHVYNLKNNLKFKLLAFWRK